MASLISQREAQRLRKRVEVLERILIQQRATFAQEWFGGVEVARCSDHETAIKIRVARRLNHAVIAIGDDGDTIRFVALPHASEDI